MRTVFDDFPMAAQKKPEPGTLDEARDIIWDLRRQLAHANERRLKSWLRSMAIIADLQKQFKSLEDMFEGRY